MATKHKDAALKKFNEGCYCSQAVLSVYLEETDMSEGAAMRLAEAFGGGIACTGQICGAVTGGLMVLGLKHGRTVADDDASQKRTIEQTRKFLATFKEKNNTLQCSELLGTEIDTPEKAGAARQKGLFDTVCPRVIADVCDILDALWESDAKEGEDTAVDSAQ